MESSLKTMSLHQIIRLGWVDCLPDHNACGTSSRIALDGDRFIK